MRFQFKDFFLRGVSKGKKIGYWLYAALLCVLCVAVVTLGVLKRGSWWPMIPLLLLILIEARFYLDMKYGYVEIGEEEIELHYVYKRRVVRKADVDSVKVCRPLFWSGGVERETFMNLLDRNGAALAAMPYVQELHEMMEEIAAKNHR